MIPGHTMDTESRKVMLYSSSYNMDYEGSEQWLVCSCGFEQRVFGEGFKTSVKHCLDVLGKEVLG